MARECDLRSHQKSRRCCGRPEPGSNSPINFIEEPEWLLIIHVMEFQFVAQTCMLLITFVIPNHLANHLTNCCMILHCLVFREHLAPDFIAFTPSVSFYIITQPGFLVKTFFNLFFNLFLNYCRLNLSSISATCVVYHT